MFFFTSMRNDHIGQSEAWTNANAAYINPGRRARGGARKRGERERESTREEAAYGVRVRPERERVKERREEGEEETN